MNYLQYHFEITPATEAASDVLAALLANAGFESFEQTKEGLTAYVQTNLLDVGALQQAVNTFPLPDIVITYRSEDVLSEDWNAQWENEVGFAPITVGKRFVVFDDRHTTPIRIRPRQAFGSGSHATTYMILDWLAQSDLTGKHVIDAGCGTGILGIAALSAGAAHVTAYDIDEWSVRNTIENAELNGLNIDVRLGDAAILSDIRPSDLVLANINRNILLADMHAFASCLAPGGQLVLSGFIAPDVEQLTEAARREGLKPVAHRHHDEWQMLVFASEAEA